MGEELIEQVTDEVKGHVTIRLVGDHNGVPGRVLAMRFSQVEGASSEEAGSKIVTLIGRLAEDGRVIASFTAQRSTEKSGETCDVMGVIVGRLADDVAEWLRDPVPDAMLGEL